MSDPTSNTMASLVKDEATSLDQLPEPQSIKTLEKVVPVPVDTTPTTKSKSGKSIATPASIAKKLLADTETEQELKALRAQVKGMEILLQQNAALEKEVDRLCSELDEVTMGVQKKGYLYKWREREIYYAPKWGLRYFVLHGNKLSYFGDETERRPRRTINLSKCFVKEEGTKKDGQFHVFGIYLGEGVDDSMEETLLLKLSTESAAEAMLWIDMLEQACAMDDKEFAASTSDPVSPFSPKSGLDSNKRAVSFKDIYEPAATTVAVEHDPMSEKSSEAGTSSKLSIEDVPPDDGWGNTPIDQDTPNGEPAMSTNMLQRVKSSNMMLQRSMSRQALSRKILAKRAPKNYSVSGSRLSSMADVKQEYTPNKKKAHLAKIIKAFPGYKPMHVTSAPSPLSGESRPGEYNFRGFFNLGVIILFLTHIDLIVNNLLKYGFKFSFLAMLKPPEAMITPEFENAALYRQTALALGTWVLSVLLNYSIEKIASKINVSERYIFLVNFLVGTFNIIMPCYWVWTSKAHPTANLVYIFQSVVMWMKLISYAHANKDLRVANRKNKRLDRESSQQALHNGYSSGEDASSPVPDNNAKPLSNDLLIGLSEVKDLQPPFLTYPQNITLKNLLYFLVVPTLCYQLNYPRTAKIRWDKVVFLLSRMFFVAIVVLFSVEQYIQPTLATSVTPMRNGDTLAIMERLLKLSIPNTYVWLLGFYFYFHCWLNLLAELTRFGDRMFYKDWWNAKTIDRYWRTWNMPVHNWVTRHLYFPLLRAGCNKTVATFAVFAFSALMHEVVISIPFQHIALHAFLGMMAQAPLIFVAKYLDRVFDNPFLGNALFWCTFCVIGQPMGILLYYNDLVKVSTPMH